MKNQEEKGITDACKMHTNAHKLPANLDRTYVTYTTKMARGDFSESCASRHKVTPTYTRSVHKRLETPAYV
jgi:hypothetical protein